MMTQDEIEHLMTLVNTHGYETWGKQEGAPNADPYAAWVKVRDYVNDLLDKKNAEIERSKTPQPTPATITDYINDDVLLHPLTEEFCQAMDEAWANGVGGGLLEVIYRWRNGKLIIPQVARLIDESDWSLPIRLANAHTALMLNWDGANYEGRHAKKPIE